jgi:hypothetical protein
MFLEKYNDVDEKIYKKPIIKKKVSFDLFTEIIYIPKYEKEYVETLWWTDYEMSITRITSRNELLSLLNQHIFMTLKQAKQLLYQPNNISYNSKNFI